MHLVQLKGKIDFENVRFGYMDGPKVLKEYLLPYSRGKQWPLLAIQAAAKLPSLVCSTGFTRYKEGAIKIDDVHIEE